MNEGAARKICLGRITSAHGLKGEVKALLAVDDLETLETVGVIELDTVSYRLVASRFQRNHLILSLAEVRTRTEAEQLAGKEIWIDAGRLPQLPAGEYYWFQIVGLEVFRADTGGYLGQVKAILPTPAHDVYVVQEKAGEYLIPAVADVIISIDPVQGRMLVAPEGLAAQDGAF